MSRIGAWMFSFWGKHPAFGDYIRINADGALFYALARWIDKSGSALRAVSPGSARFWIVPPGSDHLFCGMIMPGSDSQGRRSPVLCAVQGGVPPGPQQYWERISRGCLATWDGMAGLADRRFDTIPAFREALRGIHVPDIDNPPAPAFEESPYMDAAREAVGNSMTRNKSRFIREKMLHFLVECQSGGSADWEPWVSAVRESVEVMPCSLFAWKREGGWRLYFLYRPLAPADLKTMQQGE